MRVFVRILQGLGALVGALIAALSPIADWQGWVGDFDWRVGSFVGFVIFAVFMVWAVAQRELAIRSFKDQRPKPIVSCWFGPESDSIFVRVQNSGAKATFQVYVEITRVIDQVTPLPEGVGVPLQAVKVPWQDAKNGKIEIAKGGEERSRVFQVERANGVFDLHFLVARETDVDDFTATRWDSTAIPAKPAPIVWFKVSVVTDPAPLTEIHPHSYMFQMPNHFRRFPVPRKWLVDRFIPSRSRT